VQRRAHDRGLSAWFAARRFFGTGWSPRTVLLALLCSLGAGYGCLAQTDPERRLFGDARDCPPGHRTEFVLPAATIYVDPRWLGSSTIVDLQYRGATACPTGPFRQNGIELGYGILPVMDVHHAVGTRLMRSTDPANEPGALLEFDSRFRGWLLTLKAKS
jgi:hypothetical protein